MCCPEKLNNKLYIIKYFKQSVLKDEMQMCIIELVRVNITELFFGGDFFHMPLEGAHIPLEVQYHTWRITGREDANERQAQLEI